MTGQANSSPISPLVLLFENGSGKYIRILPAAIQFVSSASDATPVDPLDVDNIVREHQLNYIRHTLELKQFCNSEHGIRVHVRGLLRKLSG